MCGIAGIFDTQFRESPGEPELRRMIVQLRHRGPDGFGFYRDDGIGLAHARLSIIDLEGGAQPIHNEDRSVWVVFNGEIFNYLELRQDLEQRGHRFYTHSDTEVLVHLYEQYGPAFVDHLNGQFAIALWDSGMRRLVLVRDRAGILPLFYTERGGRLVFASEIKAILAGGTGARINPAGLDQLMTFWVPISPETVFEGIYEVSPGEMLIADGRGIQRHKYWDWKFPVDGRYRDGSESQLSEELAGLLADATRLRLRADVPVGAYLSGGLDSSILTTLIHRQTDVRLRTFSIGFSDRSLDESTYQEEMIHHLGAEHSSLQCSDHDVGERFFRTIWATESPLLRTAPVPMSMLSGLVRSSGYKVVLTGEGADEVFGGYDLFKEAKIRRFWAHQPHSKMRPALLKRLYPYLDLSRQQGQAYLASFFGVGLDRPDAPYFSHQPRWTTTARCKDFYSPEFRLRNQADPVDKIVASLPPEVASWHPFHRAQYLEAKSLMAGYLLSSQGDRMLMANSVEGRFPYLDHRVIEFANSMDPRLKMKVLKEKYLLRRAFSRDLPARVSARYKQPYRAPDIAAFVAGSKLDYVDELLSSRKVQEYGYFDVEKVRRLREKIRLGRAIGHKDNMAFVGILSTQVWHHLFVESLNQYLVGPEQEPTRLIHNTAVGS